ncbi:MAG TPA: polysaccharide deacetylase family protein [Caldilineaceae bacterium]|nr:polysaccharide deacetylase family protein [Caldilineaceae bacterium]
MSVTSITARFPIRYYLGKLRAKVQRRFSARAAILMYHRVFDTRTDPWSLCVKPANFAAQLQVLEQGFCVLPLAELVAAQQTGCLPDRAVAITFDDGYVDNLLYALPLLEQAQLPATFFIASGYVGEQREFWWDELERYLLQPGPLPAQLSLTIRGERLCWSLDETAGDSATGETDRGGEKLWQSPLRSRPALYYSLWQRLYPLPHQERQELLAVIANWAGVRLEGRPSHRAMTQAELRRFAQHPLVTIGGHTVTHPALAAHDVSTQRQEIFANKENLEQLLGQPMTSFSYPHGDFTTETAALVREAGLSHACTVVAEPVWQGSQPFALPRFAVEDWPGDAFARRLDQWLA